MLAELNLFLMDENIKNKVKQLLTEFLQKNGLRRTPERYAILDTIYSIKGHFKIETLYTYMESEGKFHVSRATLYNTILLLIEANLIIKHRFGNSAQYERAYNNETHHHMICIECGKVTEFQDENLKGAIANTKLKKFQASHYSLYIYGICSKCSWAKHRKKDITKRTKKGA